MTGEEYEVCCTVVAALLYAQAVAKTEDLDYTPNHESLVKECRDRALVAMDAVRRMGGLT